MKSTYPKYNVNRWLDPETDNVLYGIDRKPARGEPWAHCCLGSEPMFFGTHERAEKEIADLIAKNAAKHQPDPIAALAELAPDWATHITFDIDGTPCWQDHLGSGRLWSGYGRHQYASAFPLFNRKMRRTAIHLPTGTVYLQAADGTTTEVTRKEWDV